MDHLRNKFVPVTTYVAINSYSLNSLSFFPLSFEVNKKKKYSSSQSWETIKHKALCPEDFLHDRILNSFIPQSANTDWSLSS